MKPIFFIFSLCLFSSCLQSQSLSVFSFSGIVKDTITSKGIPFASVSVESTQKGTSTDESGEFFLLLGEADCEKKLKISCIGYTTAIFSIDEIKKSKVLYLTPAETMLNEVLIRGDSLNSVEIIRSAIKSIAKNYSQQPFELEFFSEIDVVNILNGDSCKVESILLGNYGGYSPSSKRIFEILQTRLIGKDLMNGYYVPARSIYTHDEIAHPVKLGIFNEENLEKISFKYEGATIYDGDTVYSIAYSIPKPTKKLTGYGVVPKYFKGHVTVVTSNYAIVNHQVVTDRISSQIRYRKIDGNYFPYLVLGSINQVSDDHGILTFLVTDQLRLLRTSFQGFKPISEKNYTNEFSRVKYDKLFWDSNYPR